MDRSLSDRVAIVTGASRGAGRAIAAVLGERGATVYVTGRSSGAASTQAEIGGTIEEAAKLGEARGGRRGRRHGADGPGSAGGGWRAGGRPGGTRSGPS